MGQVVRVRSVNASAFRRTIAADLTRAGVDAIDCSVVSGEQVTGDSPTDVFLRTVEIARAEGLRTLSVTLPLTTDTHAIAAVIQRAGDVGAVVCNLVPPPNAISYRDCLNSVYRSLAHLSLLAERFGVVATVRAPGRHVLLSPVELCDLIDAVHAPGAGVCIDIDALTHIGRLDDWLTTLHHRVAALNAPPNALDDHQPLINQFATRQDIIIIEQ